MPLMELESLKGAWIVSIRIKPTTSLPLSNQNQPTIAEQFIL